MKTLVSQHVRRARRITGRVPSAWAIALAEGPVSGDLRVSAPLLAPGVGPMAGFSLVADPFFVTHGSDVVVFFEAVGDAGRGEIHHATLTPDGATIYQGPVLAGDTHLSFPFVFRSPTGDGYSMIPETAESGQIQLHRSLSPYGPWELASVLAEGRPFVDTVVLQREAGWFLITETSGGTNDERTVLWCDRPDGPFETVGSWRLDSGRCRMAGRVVGAGDRPDRATLAVQDCTQTYGRRVLAETVDLPPPVDPGSWTFDSVVAEPLLEPDTRGWHSVKTHTVDLRVGTETRFGLVDGKGRPRRDRTVDPTAVARFVRSATTWAGWDLP